MIDLVLNRELVKLSKEFGFSRIYCVDLIDADDKLELKKRISKASGLIVVRANKNILRDVFENENVSVVIGLENLEDRDDLHYRRSGLDHVLSELANKNRISVGFSFHDILHAKDKGKAIGRMMQNAMLCRKYKVNVVVGSFARDKYDLRLRNDLEAFGRVIGIDKFDNTKVFKLKDNKDIKVID